MTEKLQPSPELSLFSISQLKRIEYDFRAAVIQGSQGQATELPHLNSQLIKIPTLRNGRGIALAIGGTTSLSAQWEIIDGNLTLSQHNSVPSPRMMTLDFLLQLIEKHLTDQEATSIGLNFAFNMNAASSETTDGTLVRKKTEGNVDERLYTQPLGQTLNEYLNIKYPKRKFRTSVANDSVCLSLANKQVNATSNLCGIVGTGVNFAYLREAENDSYQAISTESGHFTAIPMTQWDKLVDAESNTPGSFLTEKQMAGRYLYKIYNAIAGEKGLSYLKSTEELAAIADDKKNPANKDASVILQRSAQLTAMKISSLHTIADADQKSIDIGMEGSVFWKTPGYKTHVERWLHELNPDLNLNIYPIPDSSLLGAAMVANT